LDPSTRAARAPGRADPTYRGLVAPIYPSTTYERDADGRYPGGHSYSRDQNPTNDDVEALLAQLEGGEDAMLFASGMAAATALIDSFDDGLHVVAPNHMYWTLRRWLEDEAARGRVRLTFVTNTDVDAWAGALASAARGDGAPLAWLETPANPLGDVTDLAAVSAAAHDAGALVVADSTTATPVHTRPIEHGVDVVFHSATKQLNGHGDVLAGALVTTTADERWERVRLQRGSRGGVLGPFEAWLLLRGMRTLFVRVPRSSASALAVATALAEHPAVDEVLYAGLPDHPGHAVAARQMDSGFGMLVSFRVRGGEDAARRVLNRLELFADATSLGSTESLVEHRHRIEGAGTPVPVDLLRLSIGLEHPDDLVADLRQALDGER
jgi:cystathionine gamma-synthase